MKTGPSIPATRLLRTAAAFLLPTAGMAAVSDGLTHQRNLDESRDWHDSPYATAALPAVFHDMVGGQSATPVGLHSTRQWPAAQRGRRARGDALVGLKSSP